jgi:hypothetical protein
VERWSVGSPVELRDNGVRSFIPPSFCFELRDVSGNVVATVSRVILEIEDQGEHIGDFDALEFLHANRLMALGDVSEYDAGPEAREPGRLFLATRLVPKSSMPGPS